MAKTGSKRELHVRLDITAKRWLERNATPNGTKLVLERIKDKRRVRGDTVIHRHALPPSANGTDTVTDALESLRRVLITDVQARKQRFRLYAPNGDAVPGNTRMTTVRSWEGLPTDDDKERAEEINIEVDLLATSLREHLDLAEDMSSSPEVVLRGYVLALRDKFTPDEICAAAVYARA